MSVNDRPAILGTLHGATTHDAQSMPKHPPPCYWQELTEPRESRAPSCRVRNHEDNRNCKQMSQPRLYFGVVDVVEHAVAVSPFHLPLRSDTEANLARNVRNKSTRTELYTKTGLRPLRKFPGRRCASCSVRIKSKQMPFRARL